MNEFFTWAFLGTFAGAALATGLLTQFLKNLNIPTQLLSYIIAIIVLLGATAATGGATNLFEWLLIPFNAVLVSLASNGAFSAILRVTNKN